MRPDTIQVVMHPGAYDSPDGKPHVRLSVAAFVDVLGFREEIRRAHVAGTSDELLARFDRAIGRWYTDLSDHMAAEWSQQRQWELASFTDNIVIGCPIRRIGMSEIGFVLADLADFQLSMVRAGFFIRGGVVVDDLYMSGKLVFGVGLIDAYAIESNAAVVPRIMLGESAVREVEADVKCFASVADSVWNRTILRDEDGSFFLNYLDALWPDKTEPPIIEWLSEHKAVVTQRLAAFEGNQKVWPKYVWAARYHNYFCRTVPGGDVLQIDLSYSSLSPTQLAQIY